MRLFTGALAGGVRVAAAERTFRASAVALSKSYYDVLGVRRDASQEEIKRAYKKLAKQLHPDFNQGDESANDRFQDVQKAYDVLKDPEERETYDAAGHERYERMREAGMDASEQQQQQRGGFGSRSPFDDLFEQMFGMQMGRGADIRVGVTIDFMEAVNGCSKQVEVPHINAEEQRTGRSRKVDVEIPAGIDNGLELRMPNEGGPGMKTSQGRAPGGDLRVFVTVRSHPRFSRDGADIRCSVDVPLHVAALGGTVKVPTLSGERDLNVRKGTQPLQEFRIPEGGTRDPRTGQLGDLVVLLRVKVPTSITSRQAELLREFSEEEQRKKESVDDMFKRSSKEYAN